MRTNTNMCVFNKYTNPTTKDVVFKKHIIDNVFWDDSKGINLDKGYENADDVKVFIPLQQNNMSDYVKPKEYNGQINKWTLRKGDYIIKGNVDKQEVSNVKELSNYDTFTITVIDLKDFGSSNMQHFEIRGK